MSLVLEQITKHWLDLIQQAKEDKWEKFGAQASEANEFYQSDNHKFLFSRDNSSTSGLVVNSPKGSSHGSGLSFEATANLTANVVSVFLPVLYHKNPVRVLKPRVPAIPPDLLAEYRQAVAMEMMSSLQQQVAQNPALMADPQLQQAAMQLQQQVMMPAQPSGPSVKELEDRLRAYLIEAYLNYTPSEMGLKNHSRDAIIEAIVKGLGLLWVTVDNTGDRAIACLEYDSVDHLFKDPDAERDDDCMWIVRRRKRPAWEVERDFALEPGTLRGSDMSSDSQASTSLLDDLDREYETAQGKSSDQVVYYEVYSRMGIGGRLKAFDNSDDEELMQRLEEFGDHCYLAICPTHNVPLNLPEEVVNYDETGEETAKRLEWPIPFYKNRRNPWPFAGLSFRRKSRCAWPMSYVGPALGYQKCINWILSFLMARVKLVSRAFLLMPDGLDEEVYDTILYGSDLSLIKIKNEHPQAFEKFMEIVKMPQEDANVWQLLTQLKHEYEDATGVNELNLSARTNTQMRSAAEVDLKRDVLSVRPNDMASAVDAWMSDAAKLEAIAARYLLTAADVAPIFGEEAPDEVDMGMPEPVMQYGESTQLWVQLVSTDDIDKIVSEYEYTIESGSTRKPDKTQQVQNIDEGGSLVLQNFMQVWQQTGDPTKFNEYIAEWAKTREMTNWNVLLLPDMTQYMQQQQMMAAAAGGQPGGGAPTDGGEPPQEEPPPQEQAA